MATEKNPPQTISIGSKDSGKELILQICRYQEETGIRYAADAVRNLCRSALSAAEIKYTLMEKHYTLF